MFISTDINAPLVRSPVVDETRLLVGWQRGVVVASLVYINDVNLR